MAGHTLCVGDSFGNEAGEFPFLLKTVVDNQHNPGDAIVADMEPVFSTTLANRAGETAITQVTLQGGVNDIRVGVSAASVMAAIATMVPAALATENIERVFVIGMSPWKNWAGWSSAYQTETDSYNALLASNAAVYGYTYLDIYTPLEDGSNPDELDPAYDSGDGLHPNASGSQAIADIVNAALGDFQVSFMSGKLKNWRGAVEPAETDAGGNEIRLWRGALEPLGATSLTNLIAVTRRTASQVRPKQRMPKPRSTLRGRLGD